MGRKRKIELIAVCESCGDKPEGEKDGDWTGYKTTCSKCGGQVSLEVKDE